MNLSLFLQSGSTPQCLRDAEAEACQPLLGRWLIDLALMLNWHRPLGTVTRAMIPCGKTGAS